MKTAKVVDGKITVDPDICNNCGRCVGKCPFGCFEEYTGGYRICIGGRWGKRTAVGRPLSRIFTTEDEVMGALDKAISLFRDKGITGERFADTVKRLGFENVDAELCAGSSGIAARGSEKHETNPRSGSRGEMHR